MVLPDRTDTRAATRPRSPRLAGTPHHASTRARRGWTGRLPQKPLDAGRAALALALALPLSLPLALAACGDDVATTAAGTETDTSGEADSDSAGGPPCTAALDAGALVITEIMANPTGADEGFEWIELHNPGAEPVSLEGVRLVASKANGDSEHQHAIHDVTLEPGAYATFGNLLDAEQLAFIDHAYGDDLGDLVNSAGLVRLVCGAVEIDAVLYESEKDGASYSFNGAIPPTAAANDDKLEWCRATRLQDNFQTGDLGTPGAANSLCAPAEGECYEGTTLRSIRAPNEGDIYISEFMGNPNDSDDGNEWLELQVNADIDLNGLELGKNDVEQTFYDPLDPADPDNQEASFACVSVSAGSILLAAQSADADQNGGLPEPDLLLKSSFSVGNTNGRLFVGQGGRELAVVSYASAAEGASTALNAGATPGSDAQADPEGEGAGTWCYAAEFLSYGAGGAGTPGAPNPKCGQCLDATTMKPRDPNPAQPGDLVITEFLANPAGADGGNEWFEVYVKRDIDLAGLAAGNTLGEPKDLVPFDPSAAGTCMGASAGSYLLLVDSDAPAQPATVPMEVKPDFHVDFSLYNSGGGDAKDEPRDLFLQLREQVIDAVHYTIAPGDNESARLDQDPPDADANDDVDAAPWCLGAELTPRAANPACP